MNLRLKPIVLCLSALSLAVSGSLYAAGGSGGGGGGGGGGGTACDTTPVLPTTAPEADIIMRDSFGLGPNNVRPTGGKGCNKFLSAHTPLTGFWVEYPGSKNATWLTAPESAQSWRICVQSTDPNELPSPLQPVMFGDVMNGCVISDWMDPAQIGGDFPTAIIPFTAPAGAYEASIDGWPAPLAGMYVALGFTNSTLTVNNLQSAAGVWMLVKQGPALNNLNLVYELRADGMAGPILATGEFFSVNFNQIAVRYDPATRMAGASINGMDLGSYPVTLPGTPKFIGFEGVGILDNFVVRQR